MISRKFSKSKFILGSIFCLAMSAMLASCGGQTSDKESGTKFVNSFYCGKQGFKTVFFPEFYRSTDLCQISQTLRNMRFKCNFDCPLTVNIKPIQL